jgi:hypothetical protein
MPSLLKGQARLILAFLMAIYLGVGAGIYLTQTQINFVWGRSLGGAVATHIAQDKAIAALILESTFASMDAMARRRYWIYPTRLPRLV